METTNIFAGEAQNSEANNDRALALIAHLGGILLGFIPALIIWLIKKDDRSAQFVTIQAREALNFQITVAIAVFLSGFLIFVLIGLFFLMLVGIANVVFCIIAAVKVADGENYSYPVSLRFIS